MTLRVNVEDMVDSAMHVNNQGETLAAEHASTDARIDSAQAGWQGASAPAMSARSTKWMQNSSALLARMSDHSQGLHTAASTFASTEEQRGDTLRAVYASGSTAE
jgi:WXG100 family type VII secretion target